MKSSEINESQIYFWLKDIFWKFSFQDQGVHKIGKNHVKCFFQFLMLNIFSIKELLRKPSEIQWNIIWILQGKLKRQICWALSYKILPPEITKTWEIALLGIFWGWGNKVEFNVFFMIFWISESFSLYLLVKNSFNFKLSFFTYFEYISGVIIRKNILRSDYHSVRWYWCKKDQENLPQTSHKFFFSVLNCEFFIVVSIYDSKLL